MKIEALPKDRVGDFAGYCRKHRSEVDDSFLYEDELKKFEPGGDHPTYIVTNQEGQIIAAASLIIDEYQKRGKKARFRIFHSEIADSGIYEMLMEAVLEHTAGLRQLVIFIPVVNTELADFMAGLRFTVERYSFLLVREGLDVPEFDLPEDYTIRSFQPGQDEGIWSEVRNSAFAALLGNETPVTPEMVSKLISNESYIEDGMMILYHKDKAVGVVRGAADEYLDSPIMNIGPLAVLPEYQGKGLGRILLRASVQFARQKGYESTVLCVNAENERAKALYLQEGFRQVEAVACYIYELNN